MTAIRFAPRTSVPKVEKGTACAPRLTADREIPVVSKARNRVTY